MISKDKPFQVSGFYDLRIARIQRGSRETQELEARECGIRLAS